MDRSDQIVLVGCAIAAAGLALFQFLGWLH